MLNKPEITILLATYNGEEFLDEQLNSLNNQIVDNINILVSDDGSTDDTLIILDEWRGRWSKGYFTVLTGPQKGFCENFRFLINSLEVSDTFVAFCDQDDIWRADKLDNAFKKLASLDVNAHAMYCSRSRLIDAEGREIGFSPFFPKKPTFENALVQSLAGGNTIVLNFAAFKLLRESAKRTSFFSHDWWCYQIVMGAGGHVIYDSVPQIDYRQHGNNIFGRNNGIRAMLRRIVALFSGDYSEWIDVNLSALEKCQDLLLVNNVDLINKFKIARKGNVVNRLLFLFKNDIKRQTYIPNIGLYVSALMGKL
ncbi:glycosyltransferase [Ochrobactrum sp. SFR4]|uniref:glycosyltransferase n=1 Tax=Ochrobactrum sp. SFR4 TaxID=2717368 RepID=UPI001C8B73D0|nr:glycosyltransferase [Ochrobactrum sp. SFR4]MBX8827252.1 glycosyltransferase [Ochrobactrum sp. SFR4]